MSLTCWLDFVPCSRMTLMSLDRRRACFTAASLTRWRHPAVNSTIHADTVFDPGCAVTADVRCRTQPRSRSSRSQLGLHKYQLCCTERATSHRLVRQLQSWRSRCLWNETSACHTAAIKQDCVPNGYDVMHLPRPSVSRRTRGGGLCFIYSCDSLSALQSAVKYRSFECQLLMINTCHQPSTLSTCAHYCGISVLPSESLTRHWTGLASYLVRRSQAVHVGHKQSSRSAASTVSHKALCSARCCSHCSCHRSLTVSVSCTFVHRTQRRYGSPYTAVQHWLDLNGLSMNPDKTEAIVIGTGARQLAEGSAGTLD